MKLKRFLPALLALLAFALPLEAATLVTLPRQLVVDVNGDVRVGSKLYVYEAGTTTARTSYTTAALSVANANPVVSTSVGLFPSIWVDPDGGDYKLVLHDADDVALWTEDNLPATPLTQADIGAILHPIVAAETSAGLVAADLSEQYPYGDVRRYGATGDGSTDDCTDVNTAADVIREWIEAERIDTTTSPAPALTFGGGLVYRVNCTIWLGTTDTTAATEAKQHVRTVDLDGSTVVGYTSGEPIFDWSGGYEGVAIMRNGKVVGASSSTPNVGVLLARTSEADEGGGVNAQNADPRHFVDVQILGHYTLAGLYDYSSELLRYTRGKIWNSYSTGAPALIITNDNVRYAITSPNATLADAAGGTITAAQSTIDFKLWGTDIQNKASALGASNGNDFQASAIELWGVQEFLCDGCFINSPSVNNEHLVYISENASVQPERIVFSNGSFHSDNGTGASIKGAGTMGSLTVTNNRNVYNTLVDHSSGQITRLTVFGNDTDDTINVGTLVGAHLIIQDALTVGTSFSGFLQTTGAGTYSLPAVTATAGMWIKHDGTVDFMGGALTQVGALGATTTVGEYLSGTVTMATAATSVVSLATTEPDANYRVLLTGRANETFWATGVGVSQFTINSSNASSTAVVDWTIVR